MTDVSIPLVSSGESPLRGPRVDVQRRDHVPCAVSALDPVRLDELRATLGEERFAGLLNMLVVDCMARPRRLRECLARDDALALRAEAHNLTRAAASVGALAVATAARALASTSGGVGPGAQIALVEQAADATLRAVRHLIASATTAAVVH
jgi:HPt (histidine-containing phosphotransfer) domain-containing protein